ncbi:hypothetical protein JCM8097_002867 [Rhodosporidiobolus ruineniae]
MAPPTHYYAPPSGQHSPDNDPGQAISTLFREGGPGTTVFLKPRALYQLHSQIDLSHPETTLATEGYPAFESGEQAILETRGEKEAGAVRLFGYPKSSLKRVHVRGCRGWGSTLPSEDERERWKKEGRMGWLEGSGALIWMGGPQAWDSVVEGCRIEDPRGWTGVHLCDFAQRCKVINNIVGPCGQQAPGPWADGLSIAGKDSVIAGNTVFDATDGAIVLFCAPGTVCTNNTVIARERNLLGAINMVDDFPFDRDFEQTRVIGNHIKTEGAFIRVGIACGPTSWNPWGPHHTLVHGGSVLDNYFGPGQFGYAISLSGVQNWTVQGNTLLGGTRFGGSTHRFYPATINAPPTAFVRQWLDRGRVLESPDVQREFVDGEVQWLIGIEPEVGDKIEYEAGQVALDVRGMSRAGEGGIALKGARWEVSRRGELLLREVDEHRADKFGYGPYGAGRVLWTSANGRGGGGGDADEPQLDFTLSGAVELRTRRGQGDLLWSPSAYLAPYLSHLPSPPPEPPIPSEPVGPEKWITRPKLILQPHQPYLQLHDRDGNLLFSTSYEANNQDGWTLKQGQWIAIAPREVRGRVLDEHEGERYADDHVPTPPSAPEPGSQQGPPPVPQRPENLRPPGGEHHHHHQQHGGGRFGSFVRDLGTTLQQHGIDVGSSFPNFTHPQPTSPAQAGGPPPIPPRPDAPAGEDSGKLTPTFLYLSPETCQLILHSSPSGPSSPSPEHTHWVAPSSPYDAKDPWVSFQGDGNVVLYTSNGVPWASGVRGETMRFKGHGEEGGPAVELLNEQGERVWSSRA